MRIRFLVLLLVLLTSFTLVRAQEATPEPTPEATRDAESNTTEPTSGDITTGATVTCDSDLILLLYVAERYFGFGTVHTQMMGSGMTDVVDLSIYDRGQYAPLFDMMMMSPRSNLTDEQITTVTEMLMLDDAAMMEQMQGAMPEVDMGALTMLPDATVSDEIAECSSLRTELRRFFTVIAYAGIDIGAGAGADMGTGTETDAGDTGASPSNDVINFSTTLSGGAEVPGPGDEDGTGTAAVTVDMPNGQICYTLNVQNITLPAAAAHIHRGDAGVAGDVVVPLDNAPDASGTSTGCVIVEAALMQEIAENPASFYVNVHTDDFPGGAVRGQVAGGGAPAETATETPTDTGGDTGAPPSTDVVNFSTTLSGTLEIPGPGDADGMGTAEVTIDTPNGQICYTLNVQNISLPATGAHIHRGAAGESGDVVVPLDNAPDASGTSTGCVVVDAALMQEIAANPAGFYVNVHNDEFPAGAVRGQVSG